MPPTRVVRKPLKVQARLRRTPEEQLFVRFPGLFEWCARSLTRLPPSSRIRQALIWRMAELGFAATNRRDFEAVLLLYDPEVEIVPAPGLVSVGIETGYHGHDGFLAVWEDWDSAWASHAQWEPREFIDLGDRLLMLGRITGVGEASGIAVDTEIAILHMLKNGRVIREEHYLKHAEALEAAGLRRSHER